ncbi:MULTISPECIES: hypothetical protein [Paraburkholderia]|uniref:Uncharacterized protein n=1 Tax=Paraburkholderia megapolitana TaxID=420953 RepID=A0A1I3GHG7_9BURK|nr:MULTISPECIES: hypothetical protein [Paraburkholderia]MCX4160242.1 hypothetical protein [Paraburkholderia megapolitana]MDN7155741.1 hypothetical protein [Paraburkholderia sp. CHISQ3]MDQ6492785.1 hypothetical protein [Paraburkholderia megapolitana]QDQ82905.1 hypothetical protein FNZ07_16840 [Paraburkholderia megapolitana]SFI22919.1 hypothetical protein SAMN05192543_102519 [Paraburkholderia megapolitana]
MERALERYTDLPIGARAAFELVCARHGFAPAHFEVIAGADPDDAAHRPLVTIRRGGWAQSYFADEAGHWVRQFETDLNCRFFK